MREYLITTPYAIGDLFVEGKDRIQFEDNEQSFEEMLEEVMRVVEFEKSMIKFFEAL